MRKRSIIIILITGIILSLFLITWLISRGKIHEKTELSYGISFSKKQASDLGFDWKTVYLSILDELSVKKIRLAAYWDEIESAEGVFQWDDIDWQIEQAGQRNAEVILAIGARLPRWPECHYPGWVDEENAAEREKVLVYLEQTINRYKDNPAIKAWQIENEPFLRVFGECPEFNSGLLDKEIALARKLDDRPIIVTDSGELSFWHGAASRADIFGTTMYRDTYSKAMKSYVHYPITPAFFRAKKNIVSLFARPDDWIVIELQAEPWCSTSYQTATQADRDRTMSPQKFDEIIEFSRQAGFREFYLWGAEWWYWERAEGRPEMWEKASALFSPSNNPNTSYGL